MRTPTPASVARLAGEGLRGGDVVLLHDADHYSARGCWRSTVGALPRILEAAAAAGLQPRALPAGLGGPAGASRWGTRPSVVARRAAVSSSGRACVVAERRDDVGPDEAEHDDDDGGEHDDEGRLGAPQLRRASA